MRFARLPLVFAAFLCPGLAQAVPAHYIVLHEDAAGAVRVVASKVVDMAAIPKLAATTQWDGHGSRAERRLSVRALKDGRTVFETDAVTSAELRGEFARQDGSMESFRQASVERDYVVRLPVIAGAHALVAQPAADTAKRAAVGGASLLDIDLDALARVSPARATKAANADLIPIITSGSPANRLDILIIGDGYTAAQRAKFVQDAQDTAERFLAIGPYSDYRTLTNVSALFLASNEAGASKPSCPETPSAPVVAVDTALKASYCSGGVRRLLTVDSDLTYAAAAAAPDWDKILVIVNDAEYGGSGGAFSVASMSSMSVQIAQHEFGHAFTLLADEYSDPFPGYPPCTDAAGTSHPCEPNVTDVTGPVKWSAWFDGGTPVPSVQPASDPRAAGAWEGARFQSTGMYRQCYNGIMRTLGGSFCKVDSAAFVNRMYGGGWGVPSAGISNIESDASPSAASVTAAAGSSVAFRVHVAGPAQGIGVTWMVDGTHVQESQLASGDLASFDYAYGGGTHTVQLVAMDLSGLALVGHVSTRSWTVAAAAPTSYPLGVAKSGGGLGTVSSNPAAIDCGGTCNAQVTAGSAVTLTATPAQGSRFVGWSGACAGTAPCSFSMNGPVSVTATFAALQPGAVLAKPDALAFGGQSIGTTSPAQSASLTNSGEQPVDITAMSASDGYAVTHNCSTLQPGESCSASVTFTPGVEGSIPGSISISSSAGPYAISLTGTGERSLVTHYYQSILRRAPDADGKQFWDGEAARMRAIGANGNEAWFAMAASFFATPEYAAFARDDGGFVEDLYRTFMNRGADASGADYWRQQLAAGLPRDALVAAFTFSPEFTQFTQSVFGASTVRKEVDTVTDFYRGLLARLPDSDGFNYYLARFRQAQCTSAAAMNSQVESISSQFVLDKEYAARNRDDRAYVSDLYNAFMRRGADVDGMRSWMGKLATHAMSREDVRRAFISSNEFQARVSAMMQEGCMR